MPLELTTSQRRTLDLSSHLSVTANAGAGKTSVLARRFVEIFLRTGAKPGEVVAITFTEQAAGELRRKIHDVMLERERAGSLAPADLRRMTGLRNGLSSAVIGTIHSFCGRVLRMYPAESDVDASFTVIEGQERSRMVAEAIAETFAEMMGRGDGAGPDGPFRDLLRAVPPAKLERFLQRLFSQREQMHSYLSGRRPSAGEGVEEAGALLDRIAGAVVARAAESGWIAMAQRLADAATGRDADAVRDILRAGEAGGSGLEEALLGASGLVFTKKGEFRKSFLGRTLPGDLPAGDADAVKRFERLFGPVLRSARAADAPERESRYRRLLASLEETYAVAARRYEARKEELGVLDFEDLQLRTVSLLSDPAVRERLRSEYRWFLVDEFQDTNDLQYSILKGLVGDGEGANLFIVGDPKQSIYGFRNADVGVFYDARDEIDRMTRRTGAVGGDGASGAVVLAESFRPLPRLAAFVNLLFSGLMRRAGSRHDVDYDEIVVGRNDGVTGRVELLLAGRGSAAEDPVREECTLVARRLREMAGAGGPEARAYGECAVLLRDRTNLQALERALDEAGVPYLLAGGVGFFQTQEVCDFLNYLRFLVSPDDDAALGGILRSPFFALSDADLLGLASHPGESFWDKVCRGSDAADAPEPLRRARSLLDAHRRLAGRIPVARLLRRIAADTAWLGAMAGLSRGPQQRENFLKLLELARGRGASGPWGLCDFTAHLERRAEEEEREGQAATAAVGAAVRVMTIHAAKGLEFPVVILPFLDRPQRSDVEPIVDRQFGIGFRETGEEGAPPLYAYLRAASREKRLGEEKRIFYVACTRARDVLILSAAEREQVDEDTPLGWIRSAAVAAGVEEADSRLDFGSIPVRRHDPAGRDPVPREIGVPLPIEVRREAPPSGESVPRAPQAPAEAAAAPRRILLDPLSDTRGGDSYSATRLKTYGECPAKYYLDFILGIGAGATTHEEDERVFPGAGAPESGEGPGSAGLEGDLTHRVLSLVRGDETEASVATLIAGIAGAGPPEVAAGPLADRVAANVTAFLRSARGRAILAFAGARTEYPVSALVGDAVVTGKIDRLYPGAAGSVEFLDYKTDDVDPSGVAARTESHRTQMGIYAFLVSRLTGLAVVRCTLVFLKAGPAFIDMTFDAAALRAVERSVASAIAAIRRGEFSPPGERCASCPGRRGERCPVVPPSR